MCVSRLITDVLFRKDVHLDVALARSIVDKYYISDNSRNSNAYTNLISEDPTAMFYLPRYNSYNAKLSTNDVSAKPFTQFWNAVNRFKRIEFNNDECNYIMVNYIAKDVFDFTIGSEEVANEAFNMQEYTTLNAKIEAHLLSTVTTERVYYLLSSFNSKLVGDLAADYFGSDFAALNLTRAQLRAVSLIQL